MSSKLNISIVPKINEQLTEAKVAVCIDNNTGKQVLRLEWHERRSIFYIIIAEKYDFNIYAFIITKVVCDGPIDINVDNEGFLLTTNTSDLCS